MTFEEYLKELEQLFINLHFFRLIGNEEYRIGTIQEIQELEEYYQKNKKDKK